MEVLSAGENRMRKSTLRILGLHLSDFSAWVVATRTSHADKEEKKC
jgi:hypothetical protein